MAVYTDVGDEELAKFLAGYELGALLSCKGIAEGVENTNYLLHTGAGYFILTLYEKRVAKAELPFFLGLMEHLATRGINCPQPVKNKKGTALAELAGRPAALVTFLEGVSVRRPNVSHCAAVGRALAQLHLAGNDFKLHRRNALGLSGWEPLARTAEKRADEVAPGTAEDRRRRDRASFSALAAAIAARRDPRRSLPRQRVLPRRQALGPDRFLFRLRRTCCPTISRSVSTPGASSWTAPTTSPRAARCSRAISTCAHHRPRSWRRCRSLARGAALRFLLTRLVDWLDVPAGALVRPKDPLEYLKKLRFHQRIDHARDYGLAA